MKRILAAAVFIVLLSGCSGGAAVNKGEPSNEEIVNDANNVSSNYMAPNTVNTAGMSSQVKDGLEQEQSNIKDAEGYIFDN